MSKTCENCNLYRPMPRVEHRRAGLCRIVNLPTHETHSCNEWHEQGDESQDIETMPWLADDWELFHMAEEKADE